MGSGTSVAVAAARTTTMMISLIAAGIADDEFALRGCSAAACDLSVACAEVLFSDANPFAVGVPDDPSGSLDGALCTLFHHLRCLRLSVSALFR